MVGVSPNVAFPTMLPKARQPLVIETRACLTRACCDFKFRSLGACRLSGIVTYVSRLRETAEVVMQRGGPAAGCLVATDASARAARGMWLVTAC